MVQFWPTTINFSKQLRPYFLNTIIYNKKVYQSNQEICLKKAPATILLQTFVEHIRSVLTSSTALETSASEFPPNRNEKFRYISSFEMLYVRTHFFL